MGIFESNLVLDVLIMVLEGVQTRAAGRLKALKIQRLDNWHKRRLYAHIRGEIFGGVEHLGFQKSGRSMGFIGGRRALRKQLKGPALEKWYDPKYLTYMVTFNRRGQLHN